MNDPWEKFPSPAINSIDIPKQAEPCDDEPETVNHVFFSCYRGARLPETIIFNTARPFHRPWSFYGGADVTEKGLTLFFPDEEIIIEGVGLDRLFLMLSRKKVYQLNVVDRARIDHDQLTSYVSKITLKPIGI